MEEEMYKVDSNFNFIQNINVIKNIPIASTQSSLTRTHTRYYVHLYTSPSDVTDELFLLFGLTSPSELTLLYNVSSFSANVTLKENINIILKTMQV